MTVHESALAIYEEQMGRYRATTVTGEDRLRDRVAELEAEVARLRAMHAAACDRIAAQSEILSRRAEK